jgi:hypothetical protein
MVINQNIHAEAWERRENKNKTKNRGCMRRYVPERDNRRQSSLFNELLNLRNVGE